MWSKKDSLIFLAGAMTLHTLSHLMIHFANVLPLKFYGIVLTYSFNFYVIIFSTVITIALLWWALHIK